MTRILHLKGESDSYFAMDMTQKYSTEEMITMVEKAKYLGNKCDFYDEDNPDYWIGTLEILEFGEIDPAFIQFLDQNDLLGLYDEFKHRDFIVLD